MKQYEHGILHRLFHSYHRELSAREQFGLKEPRPLGYEKVVFPFTYLATGVIASMLIALAEMLIRKMGWNPRIWVHKPSVGEGRMSIQEYGPGSGPENGTHHDLD